MASIQRLRAAKTREDVAKLLGFTPSGLAYVLYKIPDSDKYKTFEIKKRSGGKRLIKAPEPSLKLAQRRLAKYLYDCLFELQKETPGRRPSRMVSKRTVLS